jgi:hypothetical protein
VARKYLWNKSETNAERGLPKATNFMPAEFGDVSDSEFEIGRKSKIEIQKKQSTA